jgi:hypothetical protein
MRWGFFRKQRNPMLIRWADFLEREAGYHVVSLLLIGVGVFFVDPAKRYEIAHDLVVFGTGVLARSMAGKTKGPAQP